MAKSLYGGLENDKKAEMLVRWLVNTPFYQVFAYGLNGALDSGLDPGKLPEDIKKLENLIEEMGSKDASPEDSSFEPDAVEDTGNQFAKVISSDSVLFFLGAYGGNEIERIYQAVSSVAGTSSNKDLESVLAIVAKGIQYAKAQRIAPIKIIDPSEYFQAAAVEPKGIKKVLSVADGLIGLMVGGKSDRYELISNHVLYMEVQEGLRFFFGAAIDPEHRVAEEYTLEAHKHYGMMGKELSSEQWAEWQKEHIFNEWLTQKGYDSPWSEQFRERIEAFDVLMKPKSLQVAVTSVFNYAISSGFLSAVGEHVMSSETIDAFLMNMEEMLALIGKSKNRPLYVSVLKAIGEGTVVHYAPEDRGEVAQFYQDMK